jgi:hypothetical protein
MQKALQEAKAGTAKRTRVKNSERLIDKRPMESCVHRQVGNATDGLTLRVEEVVANNVVSSLLDRKAHLRCACTRRYWRPADNIGYVASMKQR